jgi:NTE family protein
MTSNEVLPQESTAPRKDRAALPGEVIIRELIDMLPEERRKSPRVRELADWSCTTTMHIVEINARPIIGETNARDYDFSRAAIERRWQTGYADASRMLQRRPWDDPIDPVTQITVYESDVST